MAVFGNKRRTDEAHAERTGAAVAPDAVPEAAPSERRAQAGAAAASPASDAATQRRRRAPAPDGGEVAHIGKSISIHGDLTGNEDLVLDGTVEGKVTLLDNELTIGPDGRVPALVRAKSVIVIGRVEGDVVAKERIEIRSSGVVVGNLRAPRLVVAEGAVVDGAIEMSPRRDKGAGTSPEAVAPKAAAASSSPRGAA